MLYQMLLGYTESRIPYCPARHTDVRGSKPYMEDGAASIGAAHPAENQVRLCTDAARLEGKEKPCTSVR